MVNVIILTVGFRSDDAIRAACVRQPLIVSLDNAPMSLDCQKVLVDPSELRKLDVDESSSHSMILCGFGYYLYPDNSVKYFWEIKNSFGEQFGSQGYWDILSNSSLSVNSWVALNPLAPVVLDPNEPRTCIHENLVEPVSFAQLSKYVDNTDLDIIILFYDENREDKSYVKDFQ